MKTKVTLLIISVTLLLMACGQVQCGPTEMTSPPTPAVQEEVHQPQATPEPTTTVHEPDAVPITTQEQPHKESTHQEEITPQTADTPEPVEEPTHSEDIPSEIVHAKTGYVEPEPTLESEPIPMPSAPADRQAVIDAANVYAVHGRKSDTEQQHLPIPDGSTDRRIAGNTGSQGKGHGGLHFPSAHDAGWHRQPCGCGIQL